MYVWQKCNFSHQEYKKIIKKQIKINDNKIIYERKKMKIIN